MDLIYHVWQYIIAIIVSCIAPVVEDESGNTSAISDDEGPTTRHTDFSNDSENNLTCCILMLDILLKQLDLQQVEMHTGIHTTVCENVCRLLKCMVTAARVGVGSHICSMKVGFTIPLKTLISKAVFIVCSRPSVHIAKHR